MNQKVRLEEIKSLLAKKNELKTHELAKYFNVSFDTARRDVLRLTTTGQAIRIHGGLMANTADEVPTYLTRSHIQSPLKNKMAQKAVPYFETGKYYFLTPSTTIAQFCNLIHGINAGILTNSLDNAFNLMQTTFPTVSILGGNIDKSNRFSYSPAALQLLDDIHFDATFAGSARVTNQGIFTVDESDAFLSHKAISQSDKVIVFAEKYKFTTTTSSPFKSCSLNKIDILITDTPLDAKYRQWFSPQTKIISVSSEV